MGATVFYEGSAELATLTNTFTVSGVAIDPTTISLVITTPAGTATTYTYALGEITRSSAGVRLSTTTVAVPSTPLAAMVVRSSASSRRVRKRGTAGRTISGVFTSSGAVARP